MKDLTLGVNTDSIQWFSNSMWKAMPHRHFFTNNLREHFNKSGRHMPSAQRLMWTAVYTKALVDKKDTLKINSITFRVRENHETKAV